MECNLIQKTDLAMQGFNATYITHPRLLAIGDLCGLFTDIVFQLQLVEKKPKPHISVHTLMVLVVHVLMPCEILNGRVSQTPYHIQSR